MRTVHLLAVAFATLASRARAQTISVPPVEITTLTHYSSIDFDHPLILIYTSDTVAFPCTGGACNGPGFTASIGTGDTIVVRFEAPAGKRFVVTRPYGVHQRFYAVAFWRANGGVDGSPTAPIPTITFENLTGTPPTSFFDHNLVSDNGRIVQCWNEFYVTGSFSFTAMDVQFPVNHGLGHQTRTYNAVEGDLPPIPMPYFGCTRWNYGADYDAHVMTIEPIPPAPFCFGDGTEAPCPCGNSGSSGRGCENSSFTGGARLTMAGTTSPDTMVMTVRGMKPTALTIFLQGTQAISPVTYGDGLKCVHGGLRNLYHKTASGGAAFAPQAGDLSIRDRSAQVNQWIAPGATRHYVAYYRDGDAGFCPSPTGSTFNGSNAWSILW